jgi:hypothetical protein
MDSDTPGILQSIMIPALVPDRTRAERMLTVPAGRPGPRP